MTTPARDPAAGPVGDGAKLKLTAAQRHLLEPGCKGPRPGSNAWPYVEYECDGFSVPGEVIDKMIRDGLLAAREATTTTLVAQEDDVADFDIDCTHNYDATPAGRAALDASAAESGPTSEER